MSNFKRLINFQALEDGNGYFADLGHELPVPSWGTKLNAYSSFADFQKRSNEKTVTVKKLLAPLPDPTLPIYCVGLNYYSHAKEAGLGVPKNPPLWTKPYASLASPDEDVPINKFCASSLLDYEGELVFVTSRECRDISEEDAKGAILGYTCGNDLSCRLYQMPDQMGMQFFYAKAFDKFAPIGPVLVNPSVIGNAEGVSMKTKVNGEVVQEVEILKDMIFKPERILSWASQGTTIPAGTAFMSGTPSGVGVFKEPRRFLGDYDVVDVEISKIGTLHNKIVFQ